jgi:hypothetical protein
MGRPQSHNALRFYLTAFQRFDDAEILLRSKPSRTTGAVYLAGYCVECILKALVLSVTPRGLVKQTEEAITRGSEGHDLESLRQRYANRTHARMPADVVRHFLRWNSWGPRIRYQSGIMKEPVAKQFLESARRILQWADTRL